MSWKIIEKNRRLLSREEGFSPKRRGGKLTVCLVYPNRYAVGMSNLGFQSVHALLNEEPDILCDRAFLPDADDLREYRRSGTKLLSLESGEPLGSFDIIAFSVSFENDYLNIPVIFDLAGIPPLASERRPAHPLVMAGGAALFLNPEPVADFLDLVCVGEGEELLQPLLELMRAEGIVERESFLARAARLPGIYIPALYDVSYDGVRVAGRRAGHGAPEQVARLMMADPDRRESVSGILTPDTEFSDMYLMEVSRGCPRGCRFCAAGFIYLPYRQRSLDELKRQAVEGLARRGKIGLVGAAVSDHRDIGELCRFILEQGGKVSVSSLRIDRLDDGMIEVLKASGHKTVALAPEGGSQRMRDLVRKNLTEEQILAACDLLIGHDILNLKLYFIIGLPTETMDDLEEMGALVGKVRERVITAAKKNRRLGEIVLSVNPFVPKPFTPFQWCGMEDTASLEKKLKYLQQAVGKLSNVRLIAESPKDAYLQALLSRGDRRLSAFLLRSAELGSWKRAAREFDVDTDLLVYRNIPLDETLPWDVIGSAGVDRLRREYLEAFPRREAVIVS
ncbi:radical SAM protein [Geobacter sulfurreducens subsp. ethanolicus]|uniref:radical SAM protein n=1 Tax=Geobacter sulfurreducens TaxID=35554 RepID=UPI0025745E86|nr:radical SAM protein [Geobacter sulfurreducens]BEH11584.1 radical SAM protein [Geobacter sulfurreducens subsp. ethanolicus]